MLAECLVAMLSAEASVCSSWVAGLARSHQGAMQFVCSLIALCFGMEGISGESTASCECSGVIKSVGVVSLDRRLQDAQQRMAARTCQGHGEEHNDDDYYHDDNEIT